MRMKWNVTASHVISMALAVAFAMQLASLWAALTHKHVKTPMGLSETRRWQWA